MEFLLRNEAEIDKKSGNGDTALHLAIMNPKRQRLLIPAVQMLLQSGAKPYEWNGDGYMHRRERCSCCWKMEQT